MGQTDDNKWADTPFTYRDEGRNIGEYLSNEHSNETFVVQPNIFSLAVSILNVLTC